MYISAADRMVVSVAEQRPKYPQIVAVHGNETNVKIGNLFSWFRKSRSTDQGTQRICGGNQPAQGRRVTSNARLLEGSLIPAPQYADETAASDSNEKVFCAKLTPPLLEHHHLVQRRELTTCVVAVETLHYFGQELFGAAQNFAVSTNDRSCSSNVDARRVDDTHIVILREPGAAARNGSESGMISCEDHRRIELGTTVLVQISQEPVPRAIRVPPRYSGSKRRSARYPT